MSSDFQFEHKRRHIYLHRCLDELVADFISVTGRRPSDVTVMTLIKWSHSQTIKPDHLNVSLCDNKPPEAFL